LVRSDNKLETIWSLTRSSRGRIEHNFFSMEKLDNNIKVTKLFATTAMHDLD